MTSEEEKAKIDAAFARINALEKFVEATVVAFSRSATGEFLTSIDVNGQAFGFYLPEKYRDQIIINFLQAMEAQVHVIKAPPEKPIPVEEMH